MPYTCIAIIVSRSAQTDAARHITFGNYHAAAGLTRLYPLSSGTGQLRLQGESSFSLTSFAADSHVMASESRLEGPSSRRGHCPCSYVARHRRLPFHDIAGLNFAFNLSNQLFPIFRHVKRVLKLSVDILACRATRSPMACVLFSTTSAPAQPHSTRSQRRYSIRQPLSVSSGG